MLLTTARELLFRHSNHKLDANVPLNYGSRKHQIVELRVTTGLAMLANDAFGKHTNSVTL